MKLQPWEENNNLIADFVELKYDEINFDWVCPIYSLEILMYKYEGFNNNKNFLFHRSWDWLIPVVEKIESLSYKKTRHFYLFKTSSYVEIKVDRMKVNLFSKWGTNANINTREAVYKAVVEFIKWYNQNNTND